MTLIGDRLVAHMQALGYLADINGMCFGFANMAKQAVLCCEVAQFNQRLQDLTELIPEDKQEAEKLKSQYLLLAEQVSQQSQGKEDVALPDALIKFYEFIALFDGIELYHQIQKYLQLFPEGR